MIVFPLILCKYWRVGVKNGLSWPYSSQILATYLILNKIKVKVFYALSWSGFTRSGKEEQTRRREWKIKNGKKIRKRLGRRAKLYLHRQEKIGNNIMRMHTHACVHAYTQMIHLDHSWRHYWWLKKSKCRINDFYHKFFSLLFSRVTRKFAGLRIYQI